MAEFTEVIKQAQRMCKLSGFGCTKCDLNGDVGCPLRINLEYWHEGAANEIERIVMDWAEKHPEPRYPSWNEWRDANFPGVDGIIAPCAFISKKEMMRINGTRCELIPCRQCANNPIPAEIAEKLGIKPIGVKHEQS